MEWKIPTEMLEHEKKIQDLKSKLSEYENKLEMCRGAIERSMLALDDWLNIYASEHCDEDRVAQAKSRIKQFGTIRYIAEVQQQNRTTLKKLDEI